MIWFPLLGHHFKSDNQIRHTVDYHSGVAQGKIIQTALWWSVNAHAICLHDNRWFNQHWILDLFAAYIEICSWYYVEFDTLWLQGPAFEWIGHWLAPEDRVGYIFEPHKSISSLDPGGIGTVMEPLGTGRNREEPGRNRDGTVMWIVL